MADLPRLLPLAALEAALNAALSLDPVTRDRLAALEGRVVGLEFRGLGVSLYLLPGHGGFQLLGDYAGEPDTRLSGTPFGLLRLGLAPMTGSGLFGGEVTITGDVELGQRFKAILDGLEVDWEEHLSHLVGDVVAHQLGNLARGFAAWGRKSLGSLARDTGEYLQEERGWLPHRYGVDDWLTEVDLLRSDVDRMEARVQRLQQAWARRRGGI